MKRAERKSQDVAPVATVTVVETPLSMEAAIARLVAASDPAERDRAAVVVRGFGPGALGLLSDLAEDPARRAGARAGLVVLAGWATELAVGAVDGASKEDRRVGIRAVGLLGVDALPMLVSCLQDDDWSVRLTAVQLIEKLGPAATPAAPAITRTLESDPHGYVRECALRTLGTIGPEAVRAARSQVLAILRGPNRGLLEEAARQIPALGPTVANAAIPPLMESVRAGHGSEAVFRALAFLLPHAPEVALPSLIAAIEQDRLPLLPLVRRLGPVRGRAAPALASALLIPDLHDGAKALLLELGPEAHEAVPRLARALLDAPVHVRLAAAQALARIGGPAAIEALATATGDPDPSVQLAVREGLTRLRPGAVPSRPTPPRPALPAAETYAGTAPPSPLPSGLRHLSGREYQLERDGSVLVWVPAGTFTMGRADVEGEGPPYRVQVSGFFIGKHEVTRAQYGRFCGERRRTRPSDKLDGYEPTDDHPTADVSWFDAVDYCAWTGACLPTEAQWEFAARGDDGRLYPWGSEPPRSANGRVANLADATWLAGQDARRRQGAIDGYDDGARHPAPIGSFPAGASPFGCLDMSGNVAEWVQDWFDDYPEGAVADPLGGTGDSRTGGQARVVRGGCWYSGETEGTTTARAEQGGGDTDSGVGFRICVPARGVPQHHAIRLLTEGLLGRSDVLRTAEALGRYGPDAADAIPTLIGAMEPYPTIHLPMCATISQLGPAGEACLLDLAVSRDDDVACAAAAVLARTLPDRALQHFDRGLTNEATVQRRRAARAIGASRLLAAQRLPALATLLADPDAQVRGHAVGAIAAVGSEAAASEALVGLLRDADVAVVLQATWALSRTRSTSAVVEALVPGLESSDPSVAAQTEDTLVTIARAEPALCTTVLLPRLEDASPDRRLATLQLVARIGPSAGSLESALERTLTGDASPVVRAAAVEALAAIGRAKAVPVLIRVLADPTPMVRIAAVQSLGRLGSAARMAEQALTELAGQADPVMKHEADLALSRMRSRSRERTLLGVDCWSDGGALGMGLEGGAIVRATTRGSPAASIGLKLGDVIVAVDGDPVTDRAALQRLVARHRPGERVSVTFVRGGIVRCAITVLGGS